MLNDTAGVVRVERPIGKGQGTHIAYPNIELRACAIQPLHYLWCEVNAYHSIPMRNKVRHISTTATASFEDQRARFQMPFDFSHQTGVCLTG
jgi:hypothetical protein